MADAHTEPSHIYSQLCPALLLRSPRSSTLSPCTSTINAIWEHCLCPWGHNPSPGTSPWPGSWSGCNLSTKKLQTCSCKEGIRGGSEPVPHQTGQINPGAPLSLQPRHGPACLLLLVHIPQLPKRPACARKGIKVGITVKPAHEPSRPHASAAVCGRLKHTGAARAVMEALPQLVLVAERMGASLKGASFLPARKLPA